MKKILIGLAAAVVIFGGFGVAGYFIARATMPALFNQGNAMMGYQRFDGRDASRGGMSGYQRNDNDEDVRSSMMGGRGGKMGYQGNNEQEGVLHEKMVAAFAEKLGMSASDLEARLDKGETMYQVTESKEFTSEQFTTMMTEVRSQVLDQAVKDGTITQEQADWMKQRGAGMGNGRGRGEDNRMNCPYDEDNS